MKKRNKGMTTHNEHGGSLVEFIIILPLLLVILFGIIEFGILLYNQAVITNASREGARYGIVARAPRYSTEQIETRVHSFCDSNLLITFGGWKAPEVDSVLPLGSTNFGDPLEVTVEWPYTFLVLPNLPSVGLHNPIMLKAKTVMHYE